MNLDLEDFVLSFVEEEVGRHRFSTRWAEDRKFYLPLVSWLSDVAGVDYDQAVTELDALASEDRFWST